MAHLDISEQRLPQDGRIKIRVEEGELDLRISLLPTSYGESLVIRLLSSTELLKLEKIGLSELYLKQLREILKKPSGVILLTGPTGSGKTTTLYSCLSELNNIGRKIITIEDPVEYQLEGIIQMQVQPKIDFTFARGLRHMLRHDPNVMMVGEIRDPETAEIAIRSSMTGHLVFSTLHTNDAPSAIARLMDLGSAPYLVALCLECVIAQRLVRLLCSKCKKKQGSSYLPQGCDHCSNTGFYGRTAIHEFLLLDTEVKNLVANRAPASELREAATKKGMRPLKEDGLAKARAGLTTEEEVLRVA
jgi:type II secretory ATPase GspE/PulE/Tfp pilus assembly ATPase PilB-like protein